MAEVPASIARHVCTVSADGGGTPCLFEVDREEVEVGGGREGGDGLEGG